MLNLNENFTVIHAGALSILLKKKDNKYDIPTLINQLSKLTFQQACYIATTNGDLMPSDLYGLSENQTSYVKIIFDKKGLKINPDDLINRAWSNSSEEHNQIFLYLVSNGGKSIEEALKLVDQIFENNLLSKKLCI